MSTSRYRIPLKVRSLWRDRHTSVAGLARLAGIPLVRAQHAFSGHPEHRPQDRRALAPHLTMAEHAALGWAWSGDLLPVEHSEACSTPQFPKTERPGLTPLPAVATGLEAPEGPGTGGHKPLMRNRSAPVIGAPATGLLPAPKPEIRPNV